MKKYQLKFSSRIDTMTLLLIFWKRVNLKPRMGTSPLMMQTRQLRMKMLQNLTMSMVVISGGALWRRSRWLSLDLSLPFSLGSTTIWIELYFVAYKVCGIDIWSMWLYLRHGRRGFSEIKCIASEVPSVITNTYIVRCNYIIQRKIWCNYRVPFLYHYLDCW